MSAALTPLPSLALTAGKQQVAQRFGRAAKSYQQHNELQQRCAQELLQLLPAKVGQVIDLGCGPAVNTMALVALSTGYLGVDIAPEMIAEAQRQVRSVEHQHTAVNWLIADAESLPLPAASVDTIFANLSLQWVGDLVATINQFHGLLRAQGCLFFSTLLEGSMLPLGAELQALQGGQWSHRQFYSETELQQLLAALPGWQLEFKRLPVTIMNDSVLAMLKDLQGIGATYRGDVNRWQHQAQLPSVLSKSKLQALQVNMAKYRNEQGRLPIRWQVALVKMTKQTD